LSNLLRVRMTKRTRTPHLPMITQNLIPTNPGVILSRQFLEPLGGPQVAFAAHLGVPVQHINELLRRSAASPPRLHGSLLWRFTPPPSSGSISRRRMTSPGAAPLNRSRGSLRSSETLMSRIRRWTGALGFRRAPEGFGMASR
jgi:hypothetical protein